MKVPEQVLAESGRLLEASDRFYSYSQAEIDRFVEQQHYDREVDIFKE